MLDVLDFAPGDFEHLKSCHRLQTLWINCLRHLDNSAGVDEALTHLVGLSSLRALALFHGSASNKGAESLVQLASLEHLNLMYSVVDDVGADTSPVASAQVADGL